MKIDFKHCLTYTLIALLVFVIATEGTHYIELAYLHTTTFTLTSLNAIGDGLFNLLAPHKTFFIVYAQYLIWAGAFYATCTFLSVLLKEGVGFTELKAKQTYQRNTMTNPLAKTLWNLGRAKQVVQRMLFCILLFTLTPWLIMDSLVWTAKLLGYCTILTMGIACVSYQLWQTIFTKTQDQQPENLNNVFLTANNNFAVNLCWHWREGTLHFSHNKTDIGTLTEDYIQWHDVPKKKEGLQDKPNSPAEPGRWRCVTVPTDARRARAEVFRSTREYRRPGRRPPGSANPRWPAD